MPYTKADQSGRDRPAPSPGGMKRTPMKRGKRLNPRSEKLTEAMAEYLPRKAFFLGRHRECQVKVRGVCKRWSVDVHHKAGRTGAALLDETTWAAVCRACHDYLETHRDWARERGWIVARTVRK